MVILKMVLGVVAVGVAIMGVIRSVKKHQFDYSLFVAVAIFLFQLVPNDVALPWDDPDRGPTSPPPITEVGKPGPDPKEDPSPTSTQISLTPTPTPGSSVDLISANVLYNGNCYALIKTSDDRVFSMGSSSYNEGFEIWDDYSLFANCDGYALFDLKGQYAKLTFDVGRVNEYEIEDAVLNVYLNNDSTPSATYELNAQSPPVSLSIDLNYANSAKLEISGGSRVKYGFANAELIY